MTLKVTLKHEAGVKCPVSLTSKVLILESIFSQSGYTPCGLLSKAVESRGISILVHPRMEIPLVESRVAGQVFEFWSGQDFFSSFSL